MKSITIHDLDEPLWAMLKSTADAKGLSLNKTIKQLLERALGITPNAINSKKSDFQEFCSLWSKDDIAEFNKATTAFEQINPQDWQ